jgi:transposase
MLTLAAERDSSPCLKGRIMRYEFTDEE